MLIEKVVRDYDQFFNLEHNIYKHVGDIDKEYGVIKKFERGIEHHGSSLRIN